MATSRTSNTAFHLPSSSSSSLSSPKLTLDTDPDLSGPEGDDDDLDTAPLPFPTALSRRDFLTPDFNAVTYLSSLFPGSLEGGDLAHRHQTLEDLRAELRERSSAISAELLELVNSNYTAFLGLGDELKGGEERVEDVRVALLGFRRQVEEVQSRIRARREDVGKVGVELREVREDVETGRKMLELDERLDVLLGRLEYEKEGKEDDDEDDDGAEDDDRAEDEASFSGSSPSFLRELVREYIALETLADTIGRDLPYVKKMDERIARCRNTLLLDLGSSMKESRKAGEKGRDRVLKLLAVYRLIGAHSEGVKILKEK